MTDFKKLKVELRAECAARSLSQSGKRDELVERLEEYEFHEAQPEETNQAEPEVKPEIENKPEVKTVIETETEHEFITPVLAEHPTISPVQAPESIDDLAAQEEEKRRLRALRFGLDPTETAPVKIEVTIKRLEHALPNRHLHHRKHKANHNHNNRQISINKP